MKELFRERDLSRVMYYRSLLEAEGIATFVRNENVSTTEGVSIPDFFPALCVADDSQYEEAVRLIRQNLQESEAASLTEVRCGQCGEMCPGTFETCWKCGADLPAPAPPAAGG